MGLTQSATTFDERVRLDFVLTLRKRWADTLFPAMRAQYDDVIAHRDEVPRDGHGAKAVMHALDLYPWFSWIERGQQKMLWRSVQDTVVNRWDSLSASLIPPMETAGGSLELRPDLPLPKYYTAFDIHIQPGGVWSDDTSALVYEEGAQIVMLRDNDEYRFHTLFVESAIPDGPHKRIVDLGCGFGKSTRPLHDRFPDAEIIGIDLSGPNLRLAHATAERMKKPIRFVQADAAETGLDAGLADVVTGTMVLHEMPMKHVEDVIREAARLLRPGGEIHFLEFSCTGDPFRDATNYEHGERNNEPWIPVLMDADVCGMCERAGLINARWTPFDERTKGLSPDGWGARPEWHFPWSVLSAEKPA